MREISSNIRKGELKLRVETTDDLWCLKDLIESGDIIRGKTERKVNIGGEKTGKVVKKTMTLSIEAEKIDFDEQLKTLRINGKTSEDNEDVPKGSYHTIEIEENSFITVIKPKWLSYQLNKIKEACKASKSKILMVVFDRENAYFALLRNYSYDFLSEMKGEVQKKAFDDKNVKNFYDEIIKQIDEYDKRFGVDKIIAASPSFWKDYLADELKNSEIKNKIVFATCSAAGKEAFNEILKRKELENVLKEDRIRKELNLVDEVLKEIATKGKVVYGFDEVKNAVESGAAETLCISDGLIKKMRASGGFSVLELVMKCAESTKADVVVINSENEAGKKLDGLGGIAALLRYKLSYE